MATLQLSVKHTLRRRIQTHYYPPGTILPVKEELAEALHVSATTMERALGDLAVEGLLKRVQRKGTIVQPVQSAVLGRVCLLQSNDAHTNDLLVEPAYRALTEEGYGVDLVPWAGDKTVVQSHCRQLCSQPQSNGVLMILGGCSQPDLDDLLRLIGLFEHCVILHEHPSPEYIPNAHWICIDQMQMGRDVMHYLLSLGHRRIGVDAGATPNEYSFVHNLSEFCRHLLEMQGATCVPVYFGADEHGRVLERVHQDGITAYWAITDHEAVMSMNHLHRAGLQIPGDISIVGRNNTPWCESTSPSLTSTSWRPPDLAERAIHTINRLLEQQSPPRVQTIHPELIIRDSCAATSRG